jgi:hypothetical protein
MYSNQSLQQMKPPVTVRACARPAPDVFTAEARCYVHMQGRARWGHGAGVPQCGISQLTP